MAMNPSPLNYGTGGVADSAVRNRVLRNTYLLLALSMIPTVIGAWVGLRSGFNPVSYTHLTLPTSDLV